MGARGPGRRLRAAAPEGRLIQTPEAATGLTEQDARRLGRVRRFFASHPGASDVLVCVVFVLTVVATSTAQAPRVHGTAAVAVAVAVTVLGVAALAVRRRTPVTTTAALAVLGVATIAADGQIGAFALGTALGVYAVAADRPPRVVWPTLACAVLVQAGALVLWGAPATGAGGVVVAQADGTVSRVGQDAAIASDLPSLLVLTLVAMTMGANVRARRQHVRDLVHRHEQLLHASEQQASLAAAAEKTRIAREMHDIVAHGLTVMVALADGARSSVRRSPDDAEAALDLLAETGRGALADMRRMLGVLRGGDAPLDPQPDARDLDDLVQSFRAAGMAVRLTRAGAALPDDAALSLTVFRLVQESLTNALRHAGPAAQVDVLVEHRDGRVVVDVRDDGAGRLPEPAARPAGRTGRGLVGMRERAAVYGGSVTAGPLGPGWHVRVELRSSGSAGEGRG